MSDSIAIVESTEKILSLTEIQAEALRTIGRELRSQKEFFLNTDDEPGDADDSDDGEVTKERTVIRCSAVGEGRYKVRVANAVGAVALPGTTLHVLPKIPIDHFAYLARKAYSTVRTGSDAITVDSLDIFWELVASWCVEAVENLVRSGLLADYKEFTNDLKLVRGRVNVWPTTMNFLTGRMEANCNYEELDIDNPLNRVLRAAIRVVAGHPSILNQELKKRASRLDRIMDGIGQITRTDLHAPLDRRTHRYQTAIDLSHRVLGLIGTNVHSGRDFGKTFLVPTPGLMEDGIRNLLNQQLRPIQVKKSGRQIPGDVYFSVNPDLVFAGGVVTGDVKYKVATSNWNRGDVQQAAMFASGFTAEAAVIVTFSRSTDVGDIEMQLGNLPLRRIVWEAHDDVDPTVAEESMVSRIRQFLAGRIPVSAVA